MQVMIVEKQKISNMQVLEEDRQTFLLEPPQKNEQSKVHKKNHILENEL